MEALEQLDREAFARVWSRVDPAGGGMVETAPSQVREAETLRSLAETCLKDGADYRALARRARRSRGELLALAAQKTAQAKALSAAYFLRSGVRCLAHGAPAAAPAGELFSALRRRYLAERALEGELLALAASAPPELADRCRALAGETAAMARRLAAVVEREL